MDIPYDPIAEPTTHCPPSGCGQSVTVIGDHRLVFTLDSIAGQAIYDLFVTIKNSVEDADGGWNGADIIDLLTGWFTSLGFTVDACMPPRAK